MIHTLDKLAVENKTEIMQWIADKYNIIPPPLFSSVDIRNAEFKVAHVDTNLFPAGFNNLSAKSIELAAQNFRGYFKSHLPNKGKVLLIPENFTRNLRYLENIVTIREIIVQSGLEVAIGSPFIEETMELVHPEVFKVVKANKVGAYIKLENDWQPDVVVLNNDLTSGIPEEFNNISQPILPSPKLGWHTRLKSNHFKAFDKLANEFAEKFSFDPWFITTFTDNCGSIDFKNKKGLECLAQHVEKVIEKTAEKYRQYSIHKEPYAFVKADRGTYGMGVMMLRSGDDILNLNKKDRHSMGAIKHGIQNSEVMVQEGVPTIELYNDSPSETMAYMLAGNVIEMLMRSNSLKDELSNLNSNGMEILIHNDTKFGIKHVIAMLASLAVIFE